MSIQLGIILILVFQAVLLVIVLVKKSQSASIDQIQSSLQHNQELIQKDLTAIRREYREIAGETRTELAQNLNMFGNSLLNRISESASLQKGQLEIFSQQLLDLTQQNELRLKEMRQTIELKLGQIQTDTNQKLEKMRETVDEKLQSTLEKRLAQSFQSVSERLEQVHKGLGEMQNLALGVGDLKKILANVKTRGTWGEVQLGNLLEQILTKDQYAANVSTKKNSNGRVEYAIKLPGRDSQLDYIWLPIDAKFPIEEYQRLLEAEDANDSTSINNSNKALEKQLKDLAKTIASLYLDPPHTTDFAILFLPIEGLYAQILRIPGLVELIQREYRVMITGPTTITAILNSLQMGFRTLAIEQQSSQIWKTLAEVKTEFGRFGDILDKTQKKLQEASHHIDLGATRARSIQRKLKNVDTLPLDEAPSIDRLN